MSERFLAIVCVRNEAAFLLEWLAHHRACGFTDFLIYSNDCQDGTDRMLDRLAQMDHVIHRRNDGPHDARGIQFSALTAARKEPVVRRADWILPLDIDEFVNIHTGDRSVQALTSALPDATAITLTWRLFGNAGVIQFEDKPITRQFTRAAPECLNWPWRSAMFKTLHRNDGTYAGLGVHRPRHPDPDRLHTARWFDGEGRELDEHYKRTRIFSDFQRPKYRLAQLNHYPLGAMESFLIKADRGRAVHSDHTLGMDYWVERNWCSEQDTTIDKMRDATQGEWAPLMADPELAEIHAQAVAWRKARVKQLLSQEPYRALLGRLMMTPPTRPLPVQAARYLIQHAKRAQNTTQQPRRKPQ